MQEMVLGLMLLLGLGADLALTSIEPSLLSMEQSRLEAAKAEHTRARTAAESAERAVHLEKYGGAQPELSPIEAAQFRLGRSMAERQMTFDPHRIAELEESVQAELTQYRKELGHGNKKMWFWPGLKARARRKKAAKESFRKASAEERRKQKQARNRLSRMITAMGPALAELQRSRHHAQLLKLRYQQVSEKLRQLTMLNKSGGFKSIRAHKAKLKKMAKKGVDKIERQLAAFKARLESSAQQAEETPTEAETSREAETILSATGPDQLKARLQIK